MMMSFNEEVDHKKKTGVPDGHYFYLGGKKVEDYCNSLSHLGQIKPLAPVLFKIFYENGKRQKEPELIFLKIEIIDDENYVCYPED